MEIGSNQSSESVAPSIWDSVTHMRAAAALRQRLRAFVGFPQPGVVFQDLSDVYATPELLRELTDIIIARYSGEFDHVAGIESRGFLLGMAVSWAANVPLVLVRKAGKLPGAVHARTYESEYARGTLEVQKDAVPAHAHVLLVDDVVATGETLRAGAELIEGCGAKIVGLAALLELSALKGRALLNDYPFFAIHQLDDIECPN